MGTLCSHSCAAIKFGSFLELLQNDHYNFSRTWLCHPGSFRNISDQYVANDENWQQKKRTWNSISANVFGQASNFQLLPACSPKHFGSYSILPGLSFAWWPSPSNGCSRSWCGLLSCTNNLLFGILHWKS